MVPMVIGMSTRPSTSGAVVTRLSVGITIQGHISSVPLILVDWFKTNKEQHVLRRRKGNRVVESDADEAPKATHSRVVESSVDEDQRLVLPPSLFCTAIP